MLIVFNPAAGQRRASRLWHVLDIMAANGVRLELAETRRPGHATQLARDAAASGGRAVVAAGGDGTIAEVARGLSGSDCRLGVIPLGTANVLAHELDLPFAPRAVAAALAFGRTRRIWPGRAQHASGLNGVAANGATANGATPNGVLPHGPRETIFVQMLGAGFDAQVVHRLSAPMKHALGRAAYVVQGVRELSRYRFAPIRVCVDGTSMEVGSVIVSKGQYYGGRHPLAPGASPDQPGFSVALFDRADPWLALVYGLALPLHVLPRMSGLRLLRASEISISSDHVPAQADGDPAGEAPLTITDSPYPIDVIVG